MSRPRQFLSRRLCYFGLFIATTVCAALPDSGYINEELTFRRLDADVYVITHEVPWPANELLVVMADSSLVLVNTPYFSDATRELLAWIRREFGECPMIAVNGHFHNDCLGGNAALIEAKIPVYGTTQTRDLLAERGEAMRKLSLSHITEDSSLMRRMEREVWLPPDHVFEADSGLVLTFGTDSLILFYPGPAHSIDNIVAWFPQPQVLFGGCMILTGDRVGNTSDADVKAWPNSLEKLNRFPAKWIIPGHGQKFTPDLLEHTRKVLAEAQR